MYDPVLARFVSADSVVPGTASGSLQGIALKPLTVDFHEVGFGATLNSENGQLCWFQLSDTQRQQVGDPWGPTNPQALNRYSYVLNAPVRWADAGGHSRRCTEPGDEACGIVVNESSQPVLIHGDRKKIEDPTCKNSTEERCFEIVTMILKPGQSSADLGYVDTDFVRAVDDQHPIAGYDTQYLYKLKNGSIVTIKDDSSGGLTLTDTAKVWRAILQWLDTKRGNEPSGWYPANRVKDWEPANK
jgi:hypothetical protein